MAGLPMPVPSYDEEKDSFNAAWDVVKHDLARKVGGPKARPVEILKEAQTFNLLTLLRKFRNENYGNRSLYYPLGDLRLLADTATSLITQKFEFGEGNPDFQLYHSAPLRGVNFPAGGSVTVSMNGGSKFGAEVQNIGQVRLDRRHYALSNVDKFYIIIAVYYVREVELEFSGGLDWATYHNPAGPLVPIAYERASFNLAQDGRMTPRKPHSLQRITHADRSDLPDSGIVKIEEEEEEDEGPSTSYGRAGPSTRSAPVPIAGGTREKSPASSSSPSSPSSGSKTKSSGRSGDPISPEHASLLGDSSSSDDDDLFTSGAPFKPMADTVKQLARRFQPLVYGQPLPPLQMNFDAAVFPAGRGRTLVGSPPLDRHSYGQHGFYRPGQEPEFGGPRWRKYSP